MMPFIMPFNLKKWIAENQRFLDPPVGNKVVYKDSEFIIMVIGANKRTDYHINLGEEFFYQLQGDMSVRIIVNNEFKELTIREGEIFLLPKGIPHSPQRPVNSVGLVVERLRKPDELDALAWFCDQCRTPLYEEKFHVKDIVKELPLVFERFYSNSSYTTCRNCGHKHSRPE
jgi:3-hydroxyanthranilate 3,4-dioxygenase